MINMRYLFMKRVVIYTQQVIDYFYRPFNRILPADSFRYLVCGGFNTLLDVFLYFITYNFIIQKRFVNLHVIEISPHIAALMIVFPITFSTGFLLSKYITFTGSPLRGKVQIIRFGITIFSSLFIQYLLLKLFVDIFGIYPTPSKIMASIFAAIYSYFLHRSFSFHSASVKGS
jgi:putative flippase GtrA